MGRKPCCEKVGLNRGPWTIDEDKKLTNFISIHGIHCWRLVPKLAGLKRCGKSCRLRWVNYLRPDLNRQAMSMDEEDQIIELHSRFGNRWSKIATHFPGRTDNEIKNNWNTRIKKKLKLLGLDPRTHKPIEDLRPSSSLAEDRLTIEIANQKKKPEETSDPGSLNQATSSYSTTRESEILWQSFEMEATCSTSASSEETKGVLIQEEDVQNWIDCLESLISSDSVTNRF